MSGLGETIATLRRAHGLTQTELSERAAVTQAALSRYEADLRTPDDAVLAALAGALGVTPAFLARAGRVRGAMAVDAHMRRRATAKPTVWRRLEAQLNAYRMHASTLLEEVTLKADRTVPRFDPVDVLPADAARMVRMQWQLPVGPVRNVLSWLEAAGCLVVLEDFGTTRVDGMSQWIDDLPIVYLNAGLPVDRLRWTAAHELAHLVLHSAEVVEDVEAQADDFAAELLMPSETVRPQLAGLTLGRLHDLKREWNVSMQALIEKAYRLDRITTAQRAALYKTFSARGWRTREPVSDELPAESSALAASIADTMTRRGLTPDEVARIAGFASDEDNTLFRTDHDRLRLV